MVFFVFTACNYVEPPPSEGSSDIVFFVIINEAATSPTYQIVRLTLIDVDGTQLALSSGPAEGKYTIKLPQSAINETNTINFLVELKTEELLSDKIHTLAPNALARGYLRSRYLRMPHNAIPANGETVSLILDKTKLQVGYGPGSLEVSDIPYMPDFFKIDLKLSHNGIQPLLNKGYTPALAVAIGTPTPPGSSMPNDPGLRLNLAHIPPINESDILGIASPDTGWFMIMENEIVPNSACRFWVFFTKDNNYGTTHVYYHIGAIPDLGQTVEIEPAFAGIPVPDEAMLKMLALSDAERDLISSVPGAVDIRDLSESYVLTSPNYDLSNELWIPIGRDSSAQGGYGYSAFQGVFDGGGYQIWDLNYYSSPAEYVDFGLFGYAQNAKLQNFNINVGADYTQTLTFHSNLHAEHTYAGMLAGRTAGVDLTNISVNSGFFKVHRAVSGVDNYTGGIVGKKSGGVITNVTSSTSVSATGG
ncbi:MAG: hypothetical protein LBD20_03370, partial [Spirochaetaceae bacterium]|nr:hypothetical protein [Spirochaetaceae bacterium]